MTVRLYLAERNIHLQFFQWTDQKVRFDDKGWQFISRLSDLGYVDVREQRSWINPEQIPNRGSGALTLVKRGSSFSRSKVAEDSRYRLVRNAPFVVVHHGSPICLLVFARRLPRRVFMTRFLSHAWPTKPDVVG